MKGEDILTDEELKYLEKSIYTLAATMATVSFINRMLGSIVEQIEDLTYIEPSEDLKELSPDRGKSP